MTPSISLSFLGCDDAFVQENESEKQLSIQACKNGCGIAAETQVHYIQIIINLLSIGGHTLTKFRFSEILQILVLTDITFRFKI